MTSKTDNASNKKKYRLAMEKIFSQLVSKNSTPEQRSLTLISELKKQAQIHGLSRKTFATYSERFILKLCNFENWTNLTVEKAAHIYLLADFGSNDEIPKRSNLFTCDLCAVSYPRNMKYSCHGCCKKFEHKSFLDSLTMTAHKKSSPLIGNDTFKFDRCGEKMADHPRVIAIQVHEQHLCQYELIEIQVWSERGIKKTD